MNDLISVIIPEYNGKAKIDQCLNNLDTQSYSNYEVLIVDDCSSDDSVQYIENKISSLKNKEKFHLIISKENGRAGKARNTGIDIAKGKYIVFVDQDDYPSPSMLEQLYNASDSGTVDCVVCDVSDKKGSIYYRPEYKEGEVIDDTKRKFIMSCGYVFAILIKKEIVVNNHLYFPEKLLYEDSLYNCGIFASVNSIRKVNTVLYFRNDDGSSQTSFLNEKKMLDRISATKYYLSSFLENTNVMSYVDSIIPIAFYYIFISNIWWMLCEKKLYSKKVYDICMTWAKEITVDWNKVQVDGKQRGFSIYKIIILRTVYRCPSIFNSMACVLRNLKKLIRRSGK